jgi:pyruvate dehydrogenase E2 component (dihydrolipoamide acetyltransferase)
MGAKLEIVRHYGTTGGTLRSYYEGKLYFRFAEIGNVMAEIIRMPRLSDTMEEGVIVGWLKNVGDKVSPGDILAEVETDKATMELESFHEGYLLHIGVEEGAVPVDGVLAVIGEEGEDYQEQLKQAEATQPDDGQQDEKDSNAEGAESKEESPKHAESPAAAGTQASESGSDNGASGDTRVKASPLAKVMASEAGLDLSLVSGSGDQGRIVKRDIEAAISSGAARPQGVQTGPAIAEHGEFPVSQMRKTIARRLSESKFTAPHFYLTIEINMDAAITARKQINEDAEVRVSFNDLVVKACAMALREHPAVNSSWLGDKIRVNKDIHIGVAVAVDDGLLVPVVTYADQKGLRALHEEIADFASRAKEKKLQLPEMQGSTFTVSNLGMLGIEEFTAIINPPDACILAVGAIVTKPIVRDGGVVVSNVMKVTMSCDHRVVDGATGARFLQTFKNLLESPVRMLA